MHGYSVATAPPRQTATASNNNDTVSISAKAYEKQQEEIKNWAQGQCNESALAYFEQVDSGLTHSAGSSDKELMKQAQEAAYAPIDLLVYPKEVNGKLNFYYPDGTNTMDSPIYVNNGGHIPPDSYLAKYKAKWNDLREQRIETFEKMKQEGAKPFDIFVQMKKMNPLYIDGKNLS